MKELNNVTIKPVLIIGGHGTADYDLDASSRDSQWRRCRGNAEIKKRYKVHGIRCKD
jgi:hypothetical protein